MSRQRPGLVMSNVTLNDVQYSDGAPYPRSDGARSVLLPASDRISRRMLAPLTDGMFLVSFPYPTAA
jgi:hypothetical protein